MTRPLPPPLEPRCPDCSLCGKETYHDSDGFNCEHCQAWWDPEGLDTDDGEWLDPQAEQCDATVQPLVHNNLVPEKSRNKVYQCALDAGHAGNHASIDYTYAAKGWDW